MEHSTAGRRSRDGIGAGQLRARMTEYAVAHTLEPLLGDAAGATSGVDLGGVRLAFVRYGTPTRVVAEPTGEQLCWTLPIGRMEVAVGDVREPLVEGFLLDRRAPTVMLPDAQRGAVVVTTTEAALRSVQRRVLGAQASRFRVEAGPARHAQRGFVARSWRAVAASLAAASPDDSAPPPGATALTAELLMVALLAELQPEASAALTGAVHARRAALWLEARAAEPVRIDEWARSIGLSIRRLQEVVLAEYGCTPKEYLTRVRLERARALLCSAHGHATVTGIASEAGFTHLGRFAGLYRRRFGVSPSVELSRAVGRPAE